MEKKATQYKYTQDIGAAQRRVELSLSRTEKVTGESDVLSGFQRVYKGS